MRFNYIKNYLRESSGYVNLIKNKNENKFPLALYGISQSSRSLLLSTFFDDDKKDMYIFCHSDLEARTIYEDLLLFNLNVYYLPYREFVFYDLDALSNDLRWERLKVIKEMVSNNKKIIVTSIDALSVKYMPKEYYINYSFKLKVNDTVDLETLGKKLIESGYERVELVEKKGEFALRGGIIDVFPTNESFPFRVELFGDEIETIRSFNPETQRSIDTKEEIFIFPSAEIIVTKESLKRAVLSFKNELNEVIKNKTVRKALTEDGVDKLKNIINKNIESLEETWTFSNIESYLPYFFEKPATLFDYMEDASIFIMDTERSMGKLKSNEFEFKEQYEALLKKGEILKGQSELLYPYEDIKAMLYKSETLTVNDLKKTERELMPKSIVDFYEFTIYNYHGQIDMMVEDVLRKKNEGYRIVILSGTRPRGERLVDIFKERKIEAIYRDDIGEVNEKEIVITFGNQKRAMNLKILNLL